MSRASLLTTRAWIPLLAVLAASSLPCVAQPMFVGVETNNNGDTSGSLTVPVPAGLPGDLLLAVVAVYINPSTSTPTGFTPVPNFEGFNGANCASGDGAGIRCQIAAFWKFSDGTETTVFWNFGPNIRTAIGGVLRYRNTHATDPIGATASQNGTGTTATAPSVNAAENDSLIVRVAASDAAQSRSVLLNGPTTVRWSRGSADNLNSIVEVIAGAASDAPQATAGATGTATWGIAQSEQWVAGTIVIRPPAVVVDTDLAITKEDDPDKVNPGGGLTYTLAVGNNGPNDVTGATVTDSFDSDLTCSWTCSAAGASSCGSVSGAGDLSETVDVAVGDNVTFTVTCTVDAGASGSIGNTASVAVPDGFNDTDSGNDSDSTTTAVNQAPVAVCQAVTVDADQVDCLGQAEAQDFDGGSFDPDGDTPLDFSVDPTTPYVLGTTAVDLTVTDQLGLSDVCTTTITVEDNAAPVVSCNDQTTIVPPDAPISFTATGTDACGDVLVEILEFDCFKFTKRGKRIDKTGSCVVSIEGDTVTIHDSGGVGTRITWLAKGTDEAGNMISVDCGTEVVNPGKGKGLAKKRRVRRRGNG